MKQKRYNYNLFIPPEEVEQMTDEEYYECIITNLRKSKEDIKNDKFLNQNDFIKQIDEWVINNFDIGVKNDNIFK